MELEFKDVKLVISALLEEIGSINSKTSVMADMGIPANHPVGYMARGEMRDVLTTLRKFQTAYTELHNDDVCGCGQTPEEFAENTRQERETCDQFLKDIEEMEEGLTPMDPVEGIGIAVHALASRLSGEGTVFGEDGPDFTVVDLGGYL